MYCKYNSFYPLFVHVAVMDWMKAASVKSRYQLGVVHSKLITVPFSGEAET